MGLKSAVVDGIMVRAETEVPSGDLFEMVDVAKRLAQQSLDKAADVKRRRSATRAPIEDPEDVRNLFGAQAGAVERNAQMPM